MNEIMKKYDLNGFYLAKGLISKGQINLTKESIKKYYDNQLVHLKKKVPNNIDHSMKLLHKIDIERYKKTGGALWRSMELYNLLHCQNIQNFVKENFGFDDVIIPGGAGCTYYVGES